MQVLELGYTRRIWLHIQLGFLNAVKLYVFLYALVLKQTRKEVMNYTRFLLIGIEQQDGRISKNVLVVLLLMTHRSWESYTYSLNEDVWILTRYWDQNYTNITIEGKYLSLNYYYDFRKVWLIIYGKI